MTAADSGVPSAHAAANDCGPRKLTVVIPHYNHIDFLPRAIASILDQKIDGVEILVVDDGSEDSCQEKLDRLAELEPAVRIIRHSFNKGAPAALNTGLEAARGEMISFLGADDLALPGLYFAMSEALEIYPEAAFACGEIAILGDNGAVRGVRPVMAPALRRDYLTPAQVRHRLRKTDNWICNTTAVYHTCAIRNAGGFEDRLGAFCDGFIARLLAFEKGFVFVPGLFGVWRVAPNTLSASISITADKADREIQLAVEHISASSIGRVAPEYPEKYANRLRFSAARLHFVWNAENAVPVSVCKTAGLSDIDVRILTGIKRFSRFGNAGRTLAIAWLAGRLMPYGPLHVMLHLVRNRLRWWRNGERVREYIDRTEKLGQQLTDRREIL